MATTADEDIISPSSLATKRFWGKSLCVHGAHEAGHSDGMGTPMGVLQRWEFASRWASVEGWMGTRVGVAMSTVTLWGRAGRWAQEGQAQAQAQAQAWHGSLGSVDDIAVGMGMLSGCAGPPQGSGRA